MDISPEYIDMCAKAVEIQSQWKPDFIFGSVLWLKFSKEIMVDIDCNSTSGVVWLPRQDQLQEMIDGSFELIRTDLGEWQAQNDDEGGMFSTGYLKSAEQAILCLVMSHKFHKVWSGTDWIPAK